MADEFLHNESFAHYQIAVRLSEVSIQQLHSQSFEFEVVNGENGIDSYHTRVMLP